ncbi:MAG: L-fucose mutarotase, partial [Verrucomicrobiota bacterium]
LKGISPLLSPDLLALLCRMGHGDEVVLADAHFPGESLANRLVRADGLEIAPLLNGILPLFEIDPYVPDPLKMMAHVEGDALDPEVEGRYRTVLNRHVPEAPPIVRLERFAFYEQARNAFAVVLTGDTAKYGNLILTKGVTPPFSV